MYDTIEYGFYQMFHLRLFTTINYKMRVYITIFDRLRQYIFVFVLFVRVNFFSCESWAYKQQRFDFKDSFEDSDVKNFSQIVYILAFALLISIKFSLNYSGQISTGINDCFKKYLTHLISAVLRLHFTVYKQSQIIGYSILRLSMDCYKLCMT